MSDHKHYDSHDAGPEWATPAWIWQPLSDALGGFDLDPASGAEPEPIADARFTIEDDGLARNWFGDVWVNPPYGRDFNPIWADKIASEARKPGTDSVTALVQVSTDTNYWQAHYATANIFTFIDGRVSFTGAGTDSASFPSAILTWGDVPPSYITTLRTMGFVLTRD